MAAPNKKLITAVEAYFADLRRVRASGGATGERSYYPALANLFGAVGGTLKPKVFCVREGADQGAGHPDYALYTAKQVQKGRRPARGADPGAWRRRGEGSGGRCLADREVGPGEPLLGPLPAGAGDEPARLRSGRRGRVGQSGQARNLPAGGGCGRLLEQGGETSCLRPRSGCGARRIPCPCPLAPGHPDRAEGPGLAARLVRPRRTVPGRGGGQPGIAPDPPVRAGGDARDSV